MVKVGFICEGKTETLLISSDNFNSFLLSINIERVKVVDATGSGNLLPHNIEPFIESLKNAGAEKIFVLTDLDKDACITFTKNRIGARESDVVVIAIKEIEAWFLANDVMRAFLEDESFQFPNPETVDAPFETIKELLITKTKKSRINKLLLIGKLLNLGMSIENSANHPNCNSAKYFIDKLMSLSA